MIIVISPAGLLSPPPVLSVIYVTPRPHPMHSPGGPAVGLGQLAGDRLPWPWPRLSQLAQPCSIPAGMHLVRPRSSTTVAPLPSVAQVTADNTTPRHRGETEGTGDATSF